MYSDDRHCHVPERFEQEQYGAEADLFLQLPLPGVHCASLGSGLIQGSHFWQQLGASFTERSQHWPSDLPRPLLLQFHSHADSGQCPAIALSPR